MLLVARGDLALDAGLEGKLMEMEDEEEEEGLIWGDEATEGEMDRCSEERWRGREDCWG